MSEQSTQEINDSVESEVAWSKVYFSVLAFAVVTIGVLYLFSQYYSG